MWLNSICQCFYHLKGHRARSFCPTASREPCVLQAVFSRSKHCGNESEWKTRVMILFFFDSSSPLVQLAAPVWLSTFHPIHTNEKIWKWLESYEFLNCDCAKSMNAVTELNWCEKVLICVNGSQFEWAWECEWKMSGFDFCYCCDTTKLRWKFNIFENVDGIWKMNTTLGVGWNFLCGIFQSLNGVGIWKHE